MRRCRDSWSVRELSPFRSNTPPHHFFPERNLLVPTEPLPPPSGYDSWLDWAIDTMERPEMIRFDGQTPCTRRNCQLSARAELDALRCKAKEKENG